MTTSYKHGICESKAFVSNSPEQKDLIIILKPLSNARNNADDIIVKYTYNTLKELLD